MKKLGVLTDTFTGLSIKELKKIGFECVSESIIIDGQIIVEGFKETIDSLKPIVEHARELKSSMPPIGEVLDKFEEMSKKYSNIFYLAIPAFLSSAYETAKAGAGKMKNVYIPKHKLVGGALLQVAKEVLKWGNQGKSPDFLMEYVEAMSEHSITFVIPQNLANMIKSGRLNGAKKILMQKIKLIPQIYPTVNGIKITSIRRNFAKTINSSIVKIIQKIGGAKNIIRYHWEILSTGDKTADDLTMKALKEQGVGLVKHTPVSLSTFIHAGYGSIGINVWPKNLTKKS